MQIFRAFFRRVSASVLVALPLLCHGADQPENVALQYHYIGASQLAQSPNVEVAKKVFSLTSSVRFEDLVLNRLAGTLAASLHFQASPETTALLRPLLDDLVTSESLASMGGPAGQPLNYVLAVHLNASRIELWQRNLKAASRTPPDELHAENFPGWQWRQGASDSFWMVPAGDWMVVGRGEALASMRSDYLQQIQKSGRPAPALDFNWFEADVDWPRLAQWLPLSSFPLKLGRTQTAISAENQSFHMTTQVTYGQPIDWHPQPWRIPTNMIKQPLSSFVAGQDAEAFLKSDETLSHLCADPMAGQFFFWSMSQMPFQSYLAWPVENATNLMRQLSTQLPEALNPGLGAISGSQLEREPKRNQIVWTKLQLTLPVLQSAPPADGDFLVAGLFFLSPGSGPAPDALWEQFNGRSDLVYYDWEYTGPRLMELRTVTQALPILQALGMSAKDSSEPGRLDRPTLARLGAEDQWIAGLIPLLQNTVTEVTKTGPAELTVIRNSPLVFSSLELVLLSHWLSDTPAGPVNKNLLPQPKISGPGIH